MNLSQEDIEALDHHQKMVQIRTKHLYKLEEQEAAYGDLNAPTHITSQIDKLREQIREHKEEINRLETQAVQDQIPLAEVEYNVILAEAWDTPQGYPTVVGRKRLEFARLRLHIPPEKSKKMEWNIRRELASERLASIKLTPGLQEMCRDLVDNIHKDEYKRDHGLGYRVTEHFMSIIRLYPVLAIAYIFRQSPLYSYTNTRKNTTLLTEYKNRWLQVVGCDVPEDEHTEFKRLFHEYLEPRRSFDPSEWIEIIPF